jgi:hypothetical protein
MKAVSMHEDKGTIIEKGFETWKRNLKLTVPFVLMLVAIMLVAVAMAVILLYPLISASPEFLSTAGNVEDTEHLMELLSSVTNVELLQAVVLLGILAIFLASSFFTAGAIGMAKRRYR